MEDVIAEIRRFRDERDWKQFHNPKDLAISISIEAAELLEEFQWKSGPEVEKHVAGKREQISDEVERSKGSTSGLRMWKHVSTFARRCVTNVGVLDAPYFLLDRPLADALPARADHRIRTEGKGAHRLEVPIWNLKTAAGIESPVQSSGLHYAALSRVGRRCGYSGTTRDGRSGLRTSGWHISSSTPRCTEWRTGSGKRFCTPNGCSNR